MFYTLLSFVLQFWEGGGPAAYLFRRHYIFDLGYLASCTFLAYLSVEKSSFPCLQSRISLSQDKLLVSINESVVPSIQ